MRGLRQIEQTRLEVGAADDPCERAADEVARHVTGQRVTGQGVTGQPVHDGPTGAVGFGGGALPAGFEELLGRARLSGRPIPPRGRAAAESVLAEDLSGVRVHTGGAADRLARLLSARAFTIGSDIFFRQGAYAPHTRAGRALLAHELAHVAQEADGGAPVIRRKFEPSHQFAGRSQTRIGVGEKVTLSTPDAPGVRKPHWVDASQPAMGVMSETSTGGQATFTAGGRPGTATLVLRNDAEKEILRHDVTVVAPAGGVMRRVPGSQNRHLQGAWNVGFAGNQFLLPADVDFSAIQFREGAADAVRTARWPWDEPAHPAGNWQGVRQNTDAASGSPVKGDDWVYSGYHAVEQTLPAGSSATMTWNIPWFWRLRGTTDEHRFATVPHIATDSGGGRATLSKGGFTVSADADEKDTWYFADHATNIMLIRRYYENHRLGTRADGTDLTWDDIEARLKQLRTVDAMAQLIHVSREDEWDTQQFIHGLTLDQLIDVAAKSVNEPVPKR